jgi:tRNA(fMet)-specific endonuclease VapC
MKARYLLDTNHMSPAINPVSPLRDKLHHAKQIGVTFGTCVPVLCELEAGIDQSRFKESYRRQLTHILNFIRIWPIEIAVARTYGKTLNELKRRGRVLSQVDLILASLAKEMNLTLLTSDRDFEALPELPTENWLV